MILDAGCSMLVPLLIGAGLVKEENQVQPLRGVGRETRIEKRSCYER